MGIYVTYLLINAANYMFVDACYLVQRILPKMQD